MSEVSSIISRYPYRSVAARSPVRVQGAFGEDRASNDDAALTSPVQASHSDP